MEKAIEFARAANIAMAEAKLSDDIRTTAVGQFLAGQLTMAYMSTPVGAQDFSNMFQASMAQMENIEKALNTAADNTEA